ncbi:MAG: element excision factor XisH family protein [Saprospiraceae bacterium]
MPRKDTFHETVKTALRKDGWNITNDPLFVPTEGGINFFIDLGFQKQSQHGKSKKIRNSHPQSLGRICCHHIALHARCGKQNRG